MRLALRLALALAVVAAVAAGVGLWLTAPRTVAAAALPDHTADPAAGAAIFAAAGCASCHYAPKAEGEARLILSGGQRFETEFGTFAAPNISPHPAAGIGAWSDADFVTALIEGTSPDGRHYYPAFPYTSYTRMRVEDALDLFAYIKTLPPDPTPSAAHALPFPFNISRGIGLWKRLYLDPTPVVATDPRGQYLVEALGHCAECHTPRDAFGGPRRDAWLAGAPNPDGEGRIPNITPHADALSWSEADIAYYLETGFTPDFDSAGGTMAAVIDNMAQLPPEDRAAIAAYLKAVPPVAPQPRPE